jgi:hypothetical protein
MTNVMRGVYVCASQVTIDTGSARGLFCLCEGSLRFAAASPQTKAEDS